MYNNLPSNIASLRKRLPSSLWNKQCLILKVVIRAGGYSYNIIGGVFFICVSFLGKRDARNMSSLNLGCFLSGQEGKFPRLFPPNSTVAFDNVSNCNL